MKTNRGTMEKKVPDDAAADDVFIHSVFKTPNKS